MYPMIQSMILTPTPDLKDNLRARILPTPCIVHFFALFNGFQVLLLKQDIDNQSLPNQMFLWTNKQQA